MNWYKKAQDIYKRPHEAPDHTNGSPIHNLSGIYPEDLYSAEGGRYYGHYGDNRDSLSMSIIQSLKNRPNATVRIYRAIPYSKNTKEQILDLENQKRYIMKYGKLPPNYNPKADLHKKEYSEVSNYYDFLNDELKRLKDLPVEDDKKVAINPGDWVTIDRKYAEEHGQDELKGNYKIISKVVKAKDVYSDGNSIHEWGYDPS